MPQRAPIAKPPGREHDARTRERERRAGGIRRLYDSAQWRRRTQPAVLMRDAFCKIAELCGGAALSTVADHVIPAAKYVAQHGGDQRRFFDLSNLQGACAADHARKTARGG